MAKVVDRVGEEKTLFQLQRKSSIPQEGQRLIHMSQVVRAVGEDDDIVEVDQTCFPTDTG
jgi:hypothetical protein